MNRLLDTLHSLQFGWRDAIDVLIVAFILYTFLHLIRGTKAMQMSIGLLVLGGAFQVAQWLKLAALEALFRELLFYLPFVMIVLFQQELRQALTSFGRTPLIRFFARRAGDSNTAELVRAAEQIAGRHFGALIVVERTQSLRSFIATGKELDARLSADLLLNIFTPNAPLHDGAVVLQQGRIAAAGVLLPLSGNHPGTNSHGTRHRAAVGMSEETDAVIIVISEENQSIGVAVDGKLHEDVGREGLQQFLEKELGSGESA